MPDDKPGSPPEVPGSQSPPMPVSSAPTPGTSFNIGDEFGTAKRNLPPARILIIGVALIAVVAAIVSLSQRAKPQGGGEIDDIISVEVPNQNLVLVAINVTLRNTGEKPFYIHTIKGTLKTESNEFSDDPIPQVDYERYFQAFPALKEHAQAALLPETKIPPGQEAHGTVMVSFPVTQEAFNQRKSLSVIIQPYDQPVPVVLVK
jgi:hypothetical protein